MSPLHRVAIVLSLVAGCSPAEDPSRYVDPGGAFSLKLPDGWKARQPKEMLLVAEDPGSITTIMIQHEVLSPGQTLEKHIVLPKAFTILERKPAAVGELQGYRLLVTITGNPVIVKEVMYFLLKGREIYWLSAGTDEQEFDKMLPVLEQSCRSFRLGK